MEPEEKETAAPAGERENEHMPEPPAGTAQASDDETALAHQAEAAAETSAVEPAAPPLALATHDTSAVAPAPSPLGLATHDTVAAPVAPHLALATHDTVAAPAAPHLALATHDTVAGPASPHLAFATHDTVAAPVAPHLALATHDTVAAPAAPHVALATHDTVAAPAAPHLALATHDTVAAPAAPHLAFATHDTAAAAAPHLVSATQEIAAPHVALAAHETGVDRTEEVGGGEERAEEPQPHEAGAVEEAGAGEGDEEVYSAELLVEDRAGGTEERRAKLKAVIEAVIYITDEPLSAQQIAAATEQPVEQVLEVLDELAADYQRTERGLTIRELAGGYKMGTKPEHHEAIRRFVKNLKPPLKLSLAALETLAVIAYKQPVTAPEIMEIRGVQGAGVLKTLIERKLIAPAGRKAVVGKPIMYKTTREFLIQFGLKDLAELPTLKEFEELGRLALNDAEPATGPDSGPDSGPAE